MNAPPLPRSITRAPIMPHGPVFARDLPWDLCLLAVGRFPSFPRINRWVVPCTPLVRHFPHQKLSLAGTTR
jgi:hypothetical protein